MYSVISAYPLTDKFKLEITAILGASISYFLINELRENGFGCLIKTLFSIRSERLLIAVEDENSDALLPIISLIAFCTRAKKIEVIDSDSHVTRLSRFNIIILAWQLFVASIQCRLALIKAKREVAHFTKKEVEKRVCDSVENNVLYINANLWFGVKAGGSVGHIAGVINALDKLKHKVHYATVSGNDLIKDAVNVNLLSPPSMFGVPSELNLYRNSQLVTKQIVSIFSGQKFKFIYQRMSLANYVGVVVADYFKVPLILEYNGSEAWIAKNWGRQLKYHDMAIKAELLCLEKADIVVTISDVLKAELIQRGIPKEKIVMYPNCIDEEVFNPDRFTKQDCLEVRKSHGLEEQDIVATFLGTFGIWHGVEVLAETIVLILDNYMDWVEEKRLRFMLVGDGVKMQEVRNILGGWVDSKYVILTGLVPQHQGAIHLACSDILLSPHVPNGDGTPFFGSPTKLFEYMAMGKSIIASDLEQIGQVLKNSIRVQQKGEYVDSREKLSVLVEPGSIEGLSEAIIFLVNNPQIRQELGVSARQEALTTYTWQTHVKKITTSLNELRRN
jgi:glycosyltransferase involved in cell wall biosynthesis